MARSNGDTLGLGEMGYATGDSANTTTTVSMQDTSGGTSTVSFDDFGIDACTNPTANDSNALHPEDTAETYTANFTSAGSLFLSKIGNQTRNFTWSISPDVGAFTSADVGAIYTAPLVSSDTAATISYKFHDSFNDHATDYNTNKSISITITDTYGAGCFSLDTKILLSDGTEKEIQDLDMSDKLMGMKMPGMPTKGKSADDWHTYASWTTSSIDLFETCEVEIESLWFDYFESYYKITTEEDKVLTVTYEHPLFILREGIYQWTHAQTLQETDKLVNYKKEVVSITNIEFRDEELETCNVDVEPEDVYFAEYFLVHNTFHDK